MGLSLHWREFALGLGLVEAGLVVLVLVGVVSTFSAVPGFVPTPNLEFWLVGTWILWLVALQVAGAYDPIPSEPGGGRIGQIVRATVIVVAVTLLAYFLLPFTFPRGLSLVAPMAVLAALTIWREGPSRQLINWSLLQRRILLVGIDETTTRLAVALSRGSRSVPYDPVLFVTDMENPPSFVGGVPVRSGTGNLFSDVRSLRIGEIAIGSREGLTDEGQRELVKCFYDGVAATDARRLYEELTGRIMISHVGRDWYAEFPALPRRFYFGLKRALDVLLAVVAAIILSPAMLVLALLIVVDDGFPILYRQIRLGRHGAPFIIHKFRSMRNDAESDGPAYARPSDPRSTNVGRILRPSGLDELPQLWDVLRGKMSLIGPRPERPEFVDQLTSELPLYRGRLLVRPGVSGWAEVNVPHAGTLRGHLLRLEYDLYYIKHASLTLDLRIALRTLSLLFSARRWRALANEQP